MHQGRFFVVITGSTAVGKTAFVDELTQHFPVQIINADVGQLYAPLTIGTAKPDWKHHPVQHHLFDILDVPENTTVYEYVSRVRACMESIWEKGSIPIVVGGSAFYIKTLFFPLHSRPKGASQGDWDELHRLDPMRAACIEPTDTYRIERALEILHGGQILASDQAPVFETFAPCLIVFITRERTDLYTRINARVQDMFRAGWMREVDELCRNGWGDFLKKKKIIGYDVLVEYREGMYQEQELIPLVQQRTRRYAKKQETFFKKLEKQLIEAAHTSVYPLLVEKVNLTLAPVDLYIRSIAHKVTSLRREFHDKKVV